MENVDENYGFEKKIVLFVKCGERNKEKNIMFTLSNEFQTVWRVEQSSRLKKAPL